jgi:hypothetical protein
MLQRSFSVNAHNILVGIPEGKSPLGRPGRRWKDCVNNGDSEWIRLPQDMDLWRALINTVMNLSFP